MTHLAEKTSTFNSALEIGSRVVALLYAAYPDPLDIQKIIRLDYLMIHSGDVGGPESLHTPVPHRSGELLIKHELVQRGIYLMMSRGLIKQLPEVDGFKYVAEDDAGMFVSSFRSEYYKQLKMRAAWVIELYSNHTIAALDLLAKKFFGSWHLQFQNAENSHGAQT
ncbi:MAG: threonine transporter [Alphaproteobacteria bacterium]|nr:threonine transporter [Alphaproteobacteria bacterium]